MREFVLFFDRHLGERAPIALASDEQRVVPETSRTAL
jgi:hypothetical protein